MRTLFTAFHLYSRLFKKLVRRILQDLLMLLTLQHSSVLRYDRLGFIFWLIYEWNSVQFWVDFSLNSLCIVLSLKVLLFLAGWAKWEIFSGIWEWQQHRQSRRKPGEQRWWEWTLAAILLGVRFFDYIGSDFKLSKLVELKMLVTSECCLTMNQSAVL